ncbi:PFAS [Mytilus edulis]|uniref:PFAS n=1 Tax=Mytilus edulis TaxID=6550 RepID=A0A8S3V5G5_MYTED|nr:PFAS [Mytilus edulis]
MSVIYANGLELYKPKLIIVHTYTRHLFWDYTEHGNVLKEIVEPAGAIIKASQFQLGDPTISLLELWGAEYQESNAILVRPEDKDVLRKIGERERCPVSFVGKITGDGKIKVENFHQLEGDGSPAKKRTKKNFPFPVDLELEHVLGSMPRKVK